MYTLTAWHLRCTTYLGRCCTKTRLTSAVQPVSCHEIRGWIISRASHKAARSYEAASVGCTESLGLALGSLAILSHDETFQRSMMIARRFYSRSIIDLKKCQYQIDWV